MMERLTQWFGSSRLGREVGVATHLKEKYTEEELVDVFAKRLAAYEDTGLEPEEIRAIHAFFNDRSMVDFEHLVLLLEAEAKGLLVVLPCHPSPRPGYVGGALYIVSDGIVVEDYLCECTIGMNIEGKTEVSYCTHDGEAFTQGDIGKVVFLDREEAEAALRGGGSE